MISQEALSQMRERLRIGEYSMIALYDDARELMEDLQSLLKINDTAMEFVRAYKCICDLRSMKFVHRKECLWMKKIEFCRSLGLDPWFRPLMEKLK